MPRPKKKQQTTTETLTQRLKSRKLLVGVVVLASGVAIDLLVPRGLSDNLLTLLIAILGIYVTGNVGSKLATNLGTDKKTSSVQPTPKVDLSPVEKRLDEIEKSQVEYGQYLSDTMQATSNVQQQVQQLVKGG